MWRGLSYINISWFNTKKPHCILVASFISEDSQEHLALACIQWVTCVLTWPQLPPHSPPHSLMSLSWFTYSIHSPFPTYSLTHWPYNHPYPSLTPPLFTYPPLLSPSHHLLPAFPYLFNPLYLTVFTPSILTHAPIRSFNFALLFVNNFIYILLTGLCNELIFWLLLSFFCK